MARVRPKIERVTVASLCYLWYIEKEEGKVIIEKDDNTKYEFCDQYEAEESAFGNEIVASFWVKNRVLHIFLG